MINKISEYAKFIVALIGAIGTSAIVGLLTEPFSVPAIVTSVVTGLTAASVYVFPNGIQGWQKYAKAIVSAIGAVGTGVIISVLQGSVTPEAVVASITALLGFVAVYGTPNTSNPTTVYSQIK